jgi:Cupin domain
MQVHRNEDEWYYLLDGEVTFHVGEENYEGGVGSLVFLPRAVPHTFSIRTPSARMLLLNAPGGFERMVELAPATPEEAVAALARYDVQVVGPHPRPDGQGRRQRLLGGNLPRLRLSEARIPRTAVGWRRLRDSLHDDREARG